MKTTIDKVGPVVIPVPIRVEAGLTPSTRIDVSLDADGVCLIPLVSRPSLVRRNGRLVAFPMASPDQLPAVCVSALVKGERDRWPL